jgi:hypothetical protein
MPISVRSKEYQPNATEASVHTKRTYTDISNCFKNLSFLLLHRGHGSFLIVTYLGAVVRQSRHTVVLGKIIIPLRVYKQTE